LKKRKKEKKLGVNEGDWIGVNGGSKRAGDHNY
jgi:hypothetical protein